MKEISWNSIHFFSVDFCNESCKIKKEIDSKRYFKPKPDKNSKEYNKWSKKKHVCEFCKCSYSNEKSYSERFCTIFCRNQNLRKDVMTKRLEKSLETQRLKPICVCIGCNNEFKKISNSQKFCSCICREKNPIIKSNKNWAIRDFKKLKDEHQKRNRISGDILKSDHVREKLWNGKKFKAVRG